MYLLQKDARDYILASWNWKAEEAVRVAFNHIKIIKIISSLLSIAMLTSCGGGGGKAKINPTHQTTSQVPVSSSSQVVADVLPPEITLIGDAEMDLLLGSFYQEQGASAIDERDGSIDVQIDGDVDTEQMGTYIVMYTAKDAAGNLAQITRTIHVIAPPDSTPPIITLYGPYELNVSLGQAYLELGAQAWDDRDGDISVEITGEVDVSTPGVYRMTYSAVDAAGNRSQEERQVNVKAVVNPSFLTLNLNGPDVVTLLVGQPYIEMGALATDENGNDLDVTIDGEIKTHEVGTYSLTYQAVHPAGFSHQMIRIVQVAAPVSSGRLDQTPPRITLNGPHDIILTVGQTYHEWGADAFDDQDGNVNVSIFGNVNAWVAGQYTMVYTAADTVGNVASVQRLVIVEEVQPDTTPPVITLNGQTHVHLTLGDAYVEEGATASDDRDDSVRVVLSGQVDTNKAGQYTLMYTAEDASGNRSIAYRSVSVVEPKDEPPVITLNGSATVVVMKNGQYREEGALAEDDHDGSVEVDVSGTVNTSVPGEYTLTYRAVDSQRNKSTITRLVKVSVSTRPFVTTWQTQTETQPSSRSITIHRYSNHEFYYDYEIDWGDGHVQVGLRGEQAHVYQDPGTYTVKISGQFPGIQNGYRSSVFLENSKKLLAIDQWGDIQWRTMSAAFAGCINMVGKFSDAPDLSQVESMSDMFGKAERFNSPINHWDVSKVKNFSRLFRGAITFNQPLNNWELLSATNLNSMFHSAKKFNQPLNQWDLTSVAHMAALFGEAESFNQDLSAWDVSSVEYMQGMFFGAKAFNGDVTNWVTSSVKNMHYMFAGAERFNRDISKWDISSAMTTENVFAGALTFNQDLSSWDVSSISRMDNMFKGATSFNQDLSAWDVSSAIIMEDMLSETALSTENYDALLKAWSQRTLKSGVKLGVGSTQYSPSSQAARDILTETFGWQIQDGGSTSP